MRKLDIGTEISLGEENFNVISKTDDTATMSAQYNLGTDYRQSSVQNGVKFADTYGWEYTPGPKEIDVQTWSTNPKTYVNEYVTYLQGETEDTMLTGDLITLRELKKLGSTIIDDYSNSVESACMNSYYKSWLINGQNWWTRSAYSTLSIFVWRVAADGGFDFYHYTNLSTVVRPVITISKETLNKLG